jgi:Tfp pilus assembly protein PilF
MQQPTLTSNQRSNMKTGLFFFLTYSFLFFGGLSIGCFAQNVETHAFASKTEFSEIPLNVFGNLENVIAAKVESMCISSPSRGGTIMRSKYQEAARLLRGLKFAEASRKAEEIQIPERSSLEIRLLLAYAAFRAGEYASASKSSKNALLFGHEAEFGGKKLFIGIYIMSQIKLGNYFMCETLLNALIANEKKNPEQFFLYLAIIHFRNYNYQQAIAGIGQYLSKFKEDKIAKEFLEIIQKKILYFSQPMEFEKILNGDLKYPGYFTDMAFKVLSTDKNNSRIEMLLEKSIKLEPENLLAYKNLAFQRFHSLRNYTATLNDAAIIIQKDPSSPLGYFVRACALEKMGMRKEAFDSIYMALEKNPYDLDATSLLLQKFCDADDIENALYCLHRLIHIEPSNLRFLMWRAKLYLGLGEWDSAINDMNKAKKLAKGDVRIGQSIQSLKEFMEKMKKEGRTRPFSSE